ncbi:MAG: hypothetical protein FWC41_12470, partial [Firmicutes bacterium]|nr:hypothetical protein [Bacillota bacterium]
EKIDETFFDINIKSNIIDSDFRDFEVLDKDSRKQLTCGANDIETDCLPDIVDLFTSEYVDFYSVGLDWIPVRISGTPNIDPNNKIHSVDFNVIFSK